MLRTGYARVSKRCSQTPEKKFRNPTSWATDSAARVEIRGGQHKIAPTKANPLKGGDAKPRAYSPFGDTVAGPPKAPEWVGDRRPVLRGRDASVVRPHLDGEIAVASITFGALGLRGSEALQALPIFAPATATAGSRPSRHALTGAVGRSHTTPTPDPDPRDSGRRTPGALRLSELAPCLTHMVRPDRAQGLHPAPRTHQSNGVRSPMANTLGSARPTPTTSAPAASS